MNILITGVTGYLGSHLARLLVRNHTIIGTKRSTSSLDRIEKLEIALVDSDVPGALDRLFLIEQDIDLVINCATLYGRHNESIESLIDANIVFPVRLLELSTQHEVKAFINVGTSLPGNASKYALSKRQFSEWGALVGENGDPKFIDIALEHFYGPNDDPSKFTAYVLIKCIDGEELNLTSGVQYRDFIYIDDVVSALTLVINNLRNIQSGEVIPIGSGDAIQVRDFVYKIHEISNSSSQLNFGTVELRKNEPVRTCADTKILRGWGWKPHFSLEKGITEMVRAQEKQTCR